MYHDLLAKHSLSATLYGVTETSAKDWEDQNVVQAFVKATTACFKFKYPSQWRSRIAFLYYQIILQKEMFYTHYLKEQL